MENSVSSQPAVFTREDFEAGKPFLIGIECLQYVPPKREMIGDFEYNGGEYLRHQSGGFYCCVSKVTDRGAYCYKSFFSKQMKAFLKFSDCKPL